MLVPQAAVKIAIIVTHCSTHVCRKLTRDFQITGEDKAAAKTKRDTRQASMTEYCTLRHVILRLCPTIWFMIPEAQSLCFGFVAGCNPCYSHLMLCLLLFSHGCLGCIMLCPGSCKAAAKASGDACHPMGYRIAVVHIHRAQLMSCWPSQR